MMVDIILGMAFSEAKYYSIFPGHNNFNLNNEVPFPLF